jgi:hypothetical protein
VGADNADETIYTFNSDSFEKNCTGKLRQESHIEISPCAVKRFNILHLLENEGEEDDGYYIMASPWIGSTDTRIPVVALQYYPRPNDESISFQLRHTLVDPLSPTPVAPTIVCTSTAPIALDCGGRELVALGNSGQCIVWATQPPNAGDNEGSDKEYLDYWLGYISRIDGEAPIVRRLDNIPKEYREAYKVSAIALDDVYGSLAVAVDSGTRVQLFRLFG